MLYNSCYETWKQYKILRNKINNRLKYEEKYFQRKKLQECNNSSLKSWKTMKNILNWHSSGAPNRLFYYGKIRTKSQDKADKIHILLIKFNRLKWNLPPQLKTL